MIGGRPGENRYGALRRLLTMRSSRARRIIVIGNTCSGKSTLARTLSECLELPVIDLDALYWEPSWQPAAPELFRARVDEATRGERWVLAGSYLGRQQDISWPRATDVVWLDLPLPTLLVRILRRSFTRWWRDEVLWGTNVERFFPQLKLWDEHSSLVAWAVRHHREKRRAYAAATGDPRWQRIAFSRLRSAPEIESWLLALRAPES